jgi:hypothetical protein
MKLIDILNEQDDSSSNMWTRPEIGIIQKLIKKGLDRFNPSEIMGYLNELGYDSDESLDIYYLYKNNVDDNGEFDSTTAPDREKHWEGLNPQQIALGIHLQTDPATIEDKGRDNYETMDGDEYMVLTDEEADDLAIEYAKSMFEDVGVNPRFARDYIYMTDTDRRLYAQDESDMIVDEMSDEDIIREKDLEEQMDEIDEQESETTDKIDEFVTEIEDLESELEDLDEENDSERIEEINGEINILKQQINSLEKISFEGKKEDIISDAREELREERYDEIYDELDDPIEYFVESRGFYTIEELIKNGPVVVDMGRMVRDAVDGDGREHYLSSYDGVEDEQDYDGVTYYIYRTN